MSPFHPGSIVNPNMPREDEAATTSNDETDDSPHLMHPFQCQQPFNQSMDIGGHGVHPMTQNLQHHHQSTHFFQPQRHDIYQGRDFFRPQMHQPHPLNESFQPSLHDFPSARLRDIRPNLTFHPPMQEIDPGQVLPNIHQLRQSLSAGEQESGRSFQNYQSIPTSQSSGMCKVVQKLSNNTWIELEVSSDELSLKRVSEAMEHFVVSYNQTSPDLQDICDTCNCQEETVSSSQPSVVEEYTQEQQEPTLPVPSNQNQGSSRDIMAHPNCSVCRIPAESSHLNYGAHSCFSCRAFFRRSVQSKVYRNFSCVFGGNCTLTPRNRNECRKCRFEKCLKKGMKMSAVLNQSQKETKKQKQLGLKLNGTPEPKRKPVPVKLAMRKLVKKSGLEKEFEDNERPRGNSDRNILCKL